MYSEVEFLNHELFFTKYVDLQNNLILLRNPVVAKSCRDNIN